MNESRFSPATFAHSAPTRVFATAIMTTSIVVVVLAVYLTLAELPEVGALERFVLLIPGLVAGALLLLPGWKRPVWTVSRSLLVGTWLVVLAGMCLAVVASSGGLPSPALSTLFVAVVGFALIVPRLGLLISLMFLGVALFFAKGSAEIAEFGIVLAGLLAAAFLTHMAYVGLRDEARARIQSATQADARAGLLETLARAQRRVNSLDPDRVLSGALTSALELGCYEAEIWFRDVRTDKLTFRQRIGTDVRTVAEEVAQKLFVAASTGAIAELSEGDDAYVGCALYREGDLAGILVARLSPQDRSDPLLVECLELLAAQVSASLDVARSVSERRGLEERLKHWAFHDALTDLPNRVLFVDRLELALARTARSQLSVAVLFLDLDGFKQINDELGHAVGDELLLATAQRLQGCLRPNDTLARYGGDEFVVLVEEVPDVKTAELVAKRILAVLLEPIDLAGEPRVVSSSVGIALARSGPGAASDVMRRADAAMYTAKGEGGGRFVVHE